MNTRLKIKSNMTWLCVNAIVFVLTFLMPLQLTAQIVVQMPTTRIVFQRSNTNVANIPVFGKCSTSATRIEARMVSREGGNTTNWIVLDGTPSNGVFNGVISNVSGGWYNLEIKVYTSSSEIGSTVIERVGVGEVFVTAGQSNSYGNNWRQGAATDDRVSVVNYWGGGGGQIDESGQSLVFSQAGLCEECVGHTVSAGPAAPLFMWGALGDKLVQKLGVPVLFFGAGYGGTSSTMWREAANGAMTVSGGLGLTNNAPYRGLGVAIQYYLKRTGVRAVLWHQGESDNGKVSTAQYVDNINQVIAKSRVQSGFPNLSWVISRVSYYPAPYGDASHETDPAIINAQNQLASEYNNWAGPSTDDYRYPNFRKADRLHFDGDDAQFYSQLWSNQLTDDFFRNVIPSLPPTGVLITTGYLLPFSFNAGQTIQVPYLSAAPSIDNVHQVEILTEGGESLGFIGQGISNPLNVQLPVWANGRYKLRVNTMAPKFYGEVSDVITISGSGSGRPDGTPSIPSSPVPAGPNAYEGFVDLSDCNSISGWAWDVRYPDSPVVVEIVYNGTVLATQTASAFRSDLQLAGKGNGQHGYTIIIPAGLKTGSPVNYYVRIKDSSYTLVNGNRTANCQGSVTPPSPTTPIIPTNPVTPTGTFALLAPDYNCSTGSFKFQTTGGNSNTTEYMSVGITGWTINAEGYIVKPEADADKFTLFARQNGQTVTYLWDWKVACQSGATSPTPTNPTTTTNTGTVALLTPDYNCATGVFIFRTTGGNGNPIEFMSVGITGWTTNSTHQLFFPSDIGQLTLYARQNGSIVTTNWSYQKTCLGAGREAIGAGAPQIKAYPNPVTDYLTLEGLDQTSTISISTIDGKILQEISYPNLTSPIKINLGKYPAGLYTIKIFNSDHTVVKKILRQ